MRILVAIHRYVGLALALLLMVIALSGGLLLWADEYHQLRFSELRHEGPEPEVKPAALDAALQAAASPVGTIAMPREGLPAITLYYRNGAQSFHSAQDGSSISEWLPLESVYSFLFELHVHLLSGEIGHLVTGFAALLLIAMIIIGFVLWWRKRRIFHLTKWRPKGTRTHELLSSHAAQGTIAGLVMLLVLLTGAGMVFHEPTEALLKKIPGSVQQTRPGAVEIERDSEEINWAAVLAAARTSFPNAAVRMLMLPNSPHEPINIRLKQPEELHPNGRSYLSLHPLTGEVLARIDATQTGPGPSLYNLIYPLHSGKTGWPGYRLLLFIAALASVYLAVSGFWVYLRRAATRKRNRAFTKRGHPGR